ncbi:MAG: GTP cyclohydrolase I [Thermoplasmata archaeon]|nr:GTP cyclohydrolase I [Thermoplasmata archaeon]MCI4359506.1 GTP cyclohydrolase I [Thermoplasmata archaeon]
MTAKNHDEDADLNGLLVQHTRPVTEEQLRTFERYLGEMFAAMGLDLDRPATRTTPRRFLRAMFDSTEGYEGDPKLLTAFDTECHGGSDCQLSQVIEGPITFFSLCEHHALPFYGRVYIGYIGHEKILGLSKLTRLARLYAKRFTVQERLGQQVADTLVELVQPHGVGVYVEAHHICTQMRGVRETLPLTRTTCWRGRYESDAALRSEFLAMCGRQE